MNSFKYLLAAEADRIQDLLFRSSKLREVVGGSALVENFCASFKQQNLSDTDVLVCAGGAFRFMLDSPEQCSLVARSLANEYYRRTGGTLSVAKDHPKFDRSASNGFQQANHVAQISLRQAKAIRGSTSTLSHLPIVGVCASCGTGLAIDFRRVEADDEPPNYRCGPCTRKDSRNSRSIFLRKFTELVSKGRECTLEPEEIGRLDERGYVAYLKADGNAFGELFDSCMTPAQIKQLSEGLTSIMWQSLTQPAQALFQLLDQEARETSGKSLPQIPILPLIVAGDECLILLPAKWALDFAQRFCRAFETGMSQLLTDLQLPAAPTLSAAIVFCKASYPHKLAHRRLVAGLAATKREFRDHVSSQTLMTSLISFEVVKGNSMIAVDSQSNQTCWTSAQPYCVLSDDGDRGDIEFIPLKQLIECKASLKNLPNTRRNELRELFEVPPKRNDNDARKMWQSRLNQILNRMARMEQSRTELTSTKAQLHDVLCNRLGHAGDANRETDVWRVMRRDKDEQYVNGFGDLLEVWRFCESISSNTVAATEVLA